MAKPIKKKRAWKAGSNKSDRKKLTEYLAKKGIRSPSFRDAITAGTNAKRGRMPAARKRALEELGEDKTHLDDDGLF